MRKKRHDRGSALPEQAELPSSRAVTEGVEAVPVVAIGASAGGLAALRELFKHVPADSGLAFVVVVHLSPEHDSSLDELLRPYAKIPVEQVRGTTAIEKNRVYIIPPNANLDSVDTHLRLSELEKRGRDRAPIDHFFRTIANTHDGHSIGVILTGTGSDGTLGLRQIKERGGLTLVQDPLEAEYDGMPRSAIAAAWVDLVLPLAEIPDAIIRISRTRPRLVVRDDDADDENQEARQLLHKVFAQIRGRTGRDFSNYKQSTLLRRIARRMQFHHVQEPEAYLEILRKQDDEAQVLSDELLITVTSFFRDPDVFETLEREIIPKLFDRKGANESIRVWSVGCATGEEAYSLAILLLEEAARRESPVNILIFASDLHPLSLNHARDGLYLGDIDVDVSASRLKRFFQKEGGGYRVRKELREAVVFTPHNILADPPFSRLDLISCRNLLIYLQRDLQRQVAELFHYALKQDGFVLLGTSESIATNELFRVLDKKHCLYAKRNVPAPEPRLPVFPLVHSRRVIARGHLSAPGQALQYDAVHQRMLQQYAAPSVLLSPDDNIVHSSATAGRYLIHPGGAPTMSLFKLLREELRSEARAALSLARLQRKAVQTADVTLLLGAGLTRVRLLVQPELDEKQEGFALLKFEELRDTSHADTTATAGLETATPDRVLALEGEKLLADQRMQAIVEEYETSQEEIRASNEELQSANEELRSTLEELETSKEELQSMNEELQTLNQENRHKMDELGQLSNDLQNLLASTDIATLFLDRELRIMRFTPKVAELFNVRASDRGRALSDFTHRLGYSGLTADALAVFAKLIPIEREVTDETGRWYLTRILPYRSSQDRIAGVVVTFVEITQRKVAEEQLRDAKEHSEQILESLPEPLLILTSDLRVHSANAAFYEFFATSPSETTGRTVFRLGNGQWDIPALRELLEHVLPSNSAFDGYQVDHTFHDIGRRVMLLHGRRLDNRQLILLGIHDITGRFGAEEALRASELRLAAELTAMERLHELVARMANNTDEQAAMEDVLRATMELTGASLGTIHLLNAADSALEVVAQHGFDSDALSTLSRVSPDDSSTRGRAWRTKRRVVIGDLDSDPAHGEPLEVALRAGYRGVQSTPLLTREGVIVGMLSTHYTQRYHLSERDGRLIDLYGQQAADFVDRRRADGALRDSKTRLEGENRHKDEYLAMLGHELRNPFAAIRHAAELLSSEHDAPSRQRALSVLSRQSAHVSRIIDGLLDVARIANGKVLLQFKTLDLRPLITTLVEDVAPSAAERGLHVDARLGDAPVWIQGDEIRLVQVLDNLLGNALKFTEAPGSIVVTLTTDGGAAVIRVHDTGVGIRPEMLARVFETFQQEPQDGARTVGGVGLGLSLAKGLVELHRGTILARSEGRGAGTEVEIRLPLTVPPTSPAVAEARTRSIARRILVVEDNADAGAMLSAMLTRRGHHPTVVDNGGDALLALREQTFDCVVCDLGLPGVSGFDVARGVRADPLLQRIPMVALTGYSQPEDRRLSAEAGFDEHLVKPLDLNVLELFLAKLEPR